jgi:hypothetical protein
VQFGYIFGHNAAVRVASQPHCRWVNISWQQHYETLISKCWMSPKAIFISQLHKDFYRMPSTVNSLYFSINWTRKMKPHTLDNNTITSPHVNFRIIIVWPYNLAATTAPAMSYSDQHSYSTHVAEIRQKSGNFLSPVWGPHTAWRTMWRRGFPSGKPPSEIWHLKMRHTHDTTI